ncbi:hypothetical protein GDO86_013027 [Hymenochirus boettgeri]|uniref:TGF-beta family profile domain-containing protein n=1 Tax=Hymenochirus boettgeri TaxID=247094 RepID=A0A8T2IPL8_9PIPI|nr:hypothetical protein GDO86_013027 [Hymenochirus boettgeri]
MTSLIENMKKDFLWGLNLSSIPSHEKNKTPLPQIMMELYKQFAEDKVSKPVANIIRSFNSEDIVLSPALKNTDESHIIVFNISIPQHEELTLAELKIFISLSKMYPRNILVYDILHINQSKNPSNIKTVIESKRIEKSGWVTINVTRVVKRWILSGKIKNAFEISLASNSLQNNFPEDLETGVTVSRDYPPVLLIFSDDKWSKQRAKTMERKEMVLHERANGRQIVFKKSSLRNTNEKEKNKSRTGLVKTKTRFKRSLVNNYCRKSSLKVKFEDIGWDSWIISPREYDAYECKGECYYPITDNLSPTKHAIIQTLVHFKNPKTIRKACCVPTELESISILYIDDNGVTTMKYNYEEMKVAKCGCR